MSTEGYTHLMNGGMDHGWCMSYTCLKRLMTFWAVAKLHAVTTLHFSATTPQSMRIHLPFVDNGQKLILRVYYPGNMRLQVYVGERFVEDLNRLDGKSKEQLVVDGRLASNNNQGTYIQQTVSMVDTCSIAGEASDAYNCMTPRHVE